MTGAWRQLEPLSATDFNTARRLAFEACGISLHEGKLALVASRLERLVHKHRFNSYHDYLAFLCARRGGAEFSEFIDQLTTNHSGFWREPEHFVFLQRNILAGRKNSLRIWSAACATGEEPYTLAMCCLNASVPTSISASDISQTALAAATLGEYETVKTAALPFDWRDRYFETLAPGGARCRVSRSVRALVRFGRVNLLDPLEWAGLFDVIFCRNVMIYFEQATRDKLVEKLVNQLVPGGYLFTGHSETLLRLPESLQYVQPATYRKN